MKFSIFSFQFENTIQILGSINLKNLIGLYSKYKTFKVFNCDSDGIDKSINQIYVSKTSDLPLVIEEDIINAG